MPKMKTHKAAARRFEYTGSGKLVRTRHGKSHLRRNRSKRAAREYDERMPGSQRGLKRIRRLIANGHRSMTLNKPGGTAQHQQKTTPTNATGTSQGRRRLIRIANETVMKALAYAYRDRRARKGDMRRLWIQRINAAARQHGMSYSVFMAALKERGVTLNRKVLADMA